MIAAACIAPRRSAQILPTLARSSSAAPATHWAGAPTARSTRDIDQRPGPVPQATNERAAAIRRPASPIGQCEVDTDVFTARPLQRRAPAPFGPERAAPVGASNADKLAAFLGRRV